MRTMWAGAAALAVAAVGCSTDTAAGGDDLGYAAFDVCTQFVEERLRSPGSAEFPNEFEDDGEVVMTNTGGPNWTVRSHVDSQNGFGAVLRTDWVCEVAHQGGDQWRLADINMIPA